MEICQNPEIVLIGGGVIDIPLYPVSADVFRVGSSPLDCIRMQTGGDAINEAIIASRLGHRIMLISKFGDDAAGDFICNTLKQNGVDIEHVIRQPHLDTGINIVLVREDGERSFITNRNGSLRKLALSDILPELDTDAFKSARIACIASLFVSHALPIRDMAALAARIKQQGLVLCADTTSPKFGETVEDMRPLLSQLDYFFPNYDEAAKITGEQDLDRIADAFLHRGLKNIVIKIGSRGCFLKNAQMSTIVETYAQTKCVDTTGAGDNFAAGFLTALLENRSFVECARFANAVASICVEQLGATTAVTERNCVDRRYDSMIESL